MTRFALAFSAATVAVLGAASVAPAAVQLTGGDAGEGLTLVPANVVRSLDLFGLATPTVAIQGVTFTPSTTTTNGAIFKSGTVTSAPYGFGNTANDAALIQLANYISFKGGTTPADAQTFTISGLTTGTSYKLDIIQSTSDAGPRTQTLTVGGVSDTVNLVAYGVYDSVFTTTAVNGAITGTVTPTTDGTVLNGIVVSTLTTVPEPTSVALLGLGGLTLLRRRR